MFNTNYLLFRLLCILQKDRKIKNTNGVVQSDKYWVLSINENKYGHICFRLVLVESGLSNAMHIKLYLNNHFPNNPYF